VAFLVLIAFLIAPVALHDRRLGPPWRRFYIVYRYPIKTKDE
jgi:hypothetical protein